MSPLETLWPALVRAVAVEVLRMQKEEPPAPSGLLAVSKAAKQVGRTPATVKAWCRAGLLKEHRIKGCWYVNAEEFQALLKKTGGTRRKSQLRVA